MSAELILQELAAFIPLMIIPHCPPYVNHNIENNENDLIIVVVNFNLFPNFHLFRLVHYVVLVTLYPPTNHLSIQLPLYNNWSIRPSIHIHYLSLPLPFSWWNTYNRNQSPTKEDCLLLMGFLLILSRLIFFRPTDLSNLMSINW